MRGRKLLAWVLVLAVLGALSAPAALAQGETVHISSREDLEKLAQRCTVDSYSRGLRVILDQDLDLGGEEIYPIPSFSGIFEGGGHSLTGLRLATDGSHQGLFRYITAEGLVKNLKLQGSIAPENGRCQVGGLAGTNHGQILNCSFDGSVSGMNSVGGLVGENYGRVMGCSSSGTVDGKRYTGGLVGYSEGLISECVNSAQVNTAITEGGLELESLALADLSTMELTNAEDENVVSDSGGIVGFSKGVVSQCSNQGTVGYPHYGYNVGGIAGRQSGSLKDCENTGSIYGRKDIGGIVGQIEPFMILKDSVNLADELELLNTYMNRASSDLGQMSDEMSGTLDSIDASAGSAGEKLGGGGTISQPGASSGSGSDGSISGGSGGSISGGSGLSDQDLQDGLDYVDDNTSIDTDNVDVPAGLSADVNGMADGLYALFGTISSGTGAMSDDLEDVNNQLSRVIMLLANALNGAANRQILEDVSDDMEEDDPEGRVNRNVNYGAIEGDKDVGGVIGDMGIEYEFDMEGQLTEVIGLEGIVSNTYETKCVSDGNVNRGGVSARKDDAGGVVGLTELGVVLRCEGYGSGSRSDGSYVGGVVGYSHTIVRESYAMCDLSGSLYVGGIAGYGTVITDCGSMVGMSDVTACGGAVAGWADVTVEDAVSGNYFVHDSLGAVDGISYEGKAMPLSYSEMVGLEGVPEQFKSLKLSFMADGELVGEVSFAYGGRVDPSQIPAVPEKEGYTGAWPEMSLEGLTHSAVVEAVYTARQGALAAETTREGSPMSVVLVEGDFDDSTKLYLNGFTGEDPETEGLVLEKWVLRLSRLEEGQSFSVRYLPPELSARGRTVEIYVRQDGQWHKVATSRNGSYLSFDADQDTVIFAAVEVRPSPIRTVILAAAGGVAVVGVAAAILLTRKKPKKESRPEPEKQTDED